MTVAYLKLCGLNSSHTHPRASTISYVTKGTIRCGFWTENTGQFHSFALNEGQGIAFGLGALHFDQNLGCTDAFLVVAFNNEDRGTAQITKGILSLPLGILPATFVQVQIQINKTR
jgi:quercetin dioxygenase-like cupin family protein